jgi:hypothetical protein
MSAFAPCQRSAAGRAVLPERRACSRGATQRSAAGAPDAAAGRADGAARQRRRRRAGQQARQRRRRRGQARRAAGRRGRRKGPLVQLARRVVHLAGRRAGHQRERPPHTRRRSQQSAQQTRLAEGGTEGKRQAERPPLSAGPCVCATKTLWPGDHVQLSTWCLGGCLRLSQLYHRMFSTSRRRARCLAPPSGPQQLGPGQRAPPHTRRQEPPTPPRSPPGP